jgi:putative hemolysin
MLEQQIAGATNMRWAAVACTGLIAACANSPPVDNPSAPGSFRAPVDERREARALEEAQANCAKQGKHAVARRDEGQTLYDCVAN